ncbi:glucosyl-3-phosphoglycerate synthase [Corynebacterium lizhenjunii]|uniref:Glucosyl-3-phosphoglycerate synthase n=1 Tax=Corynebacterium lizhenjunii TaxID=2709394 RepID=A0A7T0KFQ1_9CORY|nr:glucosyl-3-phosphoglycerate synthase [Corynebacterium lizhenjunii]QPK79925.1 glucosyl-3-phosphoglycerate synthase [Corynebacterium lizhenjunii]
MQVSVIIPALNEEATVAAVVRACLADAADVVVIDADSTDSTAQQARSAGARVLNWREVLPDIAPRPGKGESLWRGVAAATGDVVCFIDADIESAEPGMVRALCAPLEDPTVHLVKARYERTLDGAASGGGRVTELTAKPLLREFFPDLRGVAQPLGGEYALRTSVARQLPFVEGYGVEAGLLIDVAQRWGSGAIAQVDLPPRRHRNRPLEQLAPMAQVVAHTILHRAGVVQGCAQRPPVDDVMGKTSR